MTEISQELLDELDPSHQAQKQIWREKITAYVNGTRPHQPLVAECVHIPGEPVEESDFRGEKS